MIEEQQRKLQQVGLNALEQIKDDVEFIGSYQDAPEYMKDNLYITHGYRINFHGYRKIVRSMLMIHNESVNIWSHCIPAFFIIVTVILAYSIVNTSNLNSNNTSINQSINYRFNELVNKLNQNTINAQPSSSYGQNQQSMERWPIWVFISSALICLLTSTIFHLFYPMSKKTYTLTNRFDYAGVNFLIAGSSFPVIYYGLFCQFTAVVVYLISISLLAVLCFLVCLFQWIHRTGHEKFKAMLFGGFGLSMLIPITHIFINNVINREPDDNFHFAQALPFYILLGVSYLSGLYIYTARCPERNNPGKYNICGHSHQIWHLMVVLGIIFTYFGSQKTFQMRKISICPT